MSWDYRFMNCPSENGGYNWYVLKEVYYDEKGGLRGYCEPWVGSENKEELKELVRCWAKAQRKPVLHEKDFAGE